MASNLQDALDVGDRDIFKEIEITINTTFRKIINRVKSRRKFLIQELNNLKTEYESGIKASIDSLHELEGMRVQLEQVAIKQNFALKVQESSLADLDTKIANLKSTMQQPDLTFQCHLSRLSEDLSNLGNIEVEPSNPNQVTKVTTRQQCRQETLTIGKKGKEDGNFNCPQKLHVDSITGLLYIADYYNNRIQVFNTSDWSFLLNLPTQKDVYPNSVATSKEYCYATSFSSDTILQYSQSSLQLLKSVSKTGGCCPKLNGPSHIAVSPRNEVFVADWSNHRVCVFSKDLFYLREIGVGLLIIPKHVVLSGELVYVLDDNEVNCIHVFSGEGMLLKSFLEKGIDVKNPISFCLDQLGNVIVTDYGSDSVKVFSTDGLVSVVSGVSSEVNGYYSVVVCGDRYVVSCRELHCVKVF